MTLTAYFLSQQYEKLAELGDRLGEVEKLIDWSRFLPIISDMYHDDPLHGGRPHTDEIILIKLLILQQWYGLSDYELERQSLDRVSFFNFLGRPNSIPDRSTIWYFFEQLKKTTRRMRFGMNFKTRSKDLD